MTETLTNAINANLELVALIVAVWSGAPWFAAGAAFWAQLNRAKPITWVTAPLWAAFVGLIAWAVTFSINVWARGGSL